MYVHYVSVEAFKRVLRVDWAPGSGLNVVCGQNAQGKSSSLDAIMAALGGQSFVEGNPTHEGHSRAKVVLKVGPYTVTRSWDGESGRMTLRFVKDVGADEPVAISGPQGVLDALMGGPAAKSLSFDPLAFANEKPKEQLKILRKLAKCDTGDVEAAIRDLEAERLALGRVRDRLPPAPEESPNFDKLRNAVALAKEAAENEAASNAKASQVVNAHQRLPGVRAAHRAKLESLSAQSARASQEIAEMRAKIARLESDIAKWADDAKKEQEAAAKIEEWAQANPLPGPLPKVAAEALTAANAKLREAEDAEAKAKQRRDLDRDYKTLTSRIEAERGRRDEMLASATFPIAGLGFAEDGVTYNGRPLDQASSAERLRVSLAMAAASATGELKLVLIREGSLLDDTAMVELGAWAKDNNVQVLVERVGHAAGQIGETVLEIVDGRSVEKQ